MSWTGVRAALVHGLEVELEVGRVPALAVLIRFLGDDDLVHEAAKGAVAMGKPRHLDAAQVDLQTLQETHEIPDRPDVKGHERVHVPNAVHTGVDRVGDEGFARILVVGKELSNPRGGPVFGFGAVAVGEPETGHEIFLCG